ncbi:MAG: DUF3810 domain-containing protein [Lachnospiraceae bacterium]|nr:DUF3810 domain-containing protein [Lachnospiraceae bacterium]
MAKNNPKIAENVFARGIFRAYAWLVSHITGVIPFSLAEVLLILFPIFVICVIVKGIVKTVRERGRRLLAAGGLVRDLVCIVGVVFLWFMIGAGTNYYRYEFSQYSGLEIRKSSTEELYRLCAELAVKAREARNEAMEEALVQEDWDQEDWDKISFTSGHSDRELAYEAKLAMEKLGGSYEVLAGYYPRPKAVFFSRFMSEFNITGVYFPWTVEANVNVDVPDYTIGAALCHELSHLRGFMREDEANFIGYLGCINSDCAELRYSGYMLALVYAGNKLYADSPELYSEVFATYSEGMIEDFREHSRYWKQFEDTVLSEVGEKMNDTYLKANNQTDGTKSYGRMVDLLLAQYRAEHN